MSTMKQVVALIATGVITVPSVSAETSPADSSASRPIGDANAISLSAMAAPAESRDSKTELEAGRKKPEGRVHARIDWVKSPAKMDRTEHPQK